MRIFDQLVIGIFSIYLTYYCRKHYSNSSSEILLTLKDRFLPNLFPTTTTTALFEPTPLLETMSTPRQIAKVFEAIEQSEGAGARVRRSVGTAKLRNFSPFLMLDHFTIGEGAGFPDHPHR